MASPRGHLGNRAGLSSARPVFASTSLFCDEGWKSELGYCSLSTFYLLPMPPAIALSLRPTCVLWGQPFAEKIQQRYYCVDSIRGNKGSVDFGSFSCSGVRFPCEVLAGIRLLCLSGRGGVGNRCVTALQIIHLCGSALLERLQPGSIGAISKIFSRAKP